MIAALLGPLLVASSFAAPARALTTTAETSGYKVTGRYDEVVRLCHDFQRAYRNVTCETFGQSPEQRPMLALSVGARKKPTLLVQ
ncbi:MAG TPA: peptidase M14, partial [Polyangia bacterium]